MELPIHQKLSQSGILPPEAIKSRLLDRYAFASDASHFYLVPALVVQPYKVQQIKDLFVFAQKNDTPLVFRAGGTSLSGQSVTDGILVDLSRHWREYQIQENGAKIMLEPGVIGANANIALKKYGRKIGPDPASINAAMMGGILSNNSSGMCCGVAQNAYHTLSSLHFVLPDSSEYNTAQSSDYQRFERESPSICTGILDLKKRIESDAALCERIRSKYRQKNTTGYSLNAFLDFEHPLDILAHLLIGAEGTLAFIAGAVLHTVPDYPCKMTGMLYFDSPEAACNAIFDLKNTGAEALEFMDRAALRSVENMKGVPVLLKDLPARAAAILCEYQAENDTVLQQKYQRALPILQKLQLIHPQVFTQDAQEQAIYWKIRKGMYPSVASVRAKGTATMLEDLTFPIEKLGPAIRDVQLLFEQYCYDNGIIFGHAKDGNLHFCISQRFDSQEEINRFAEFNEDLFELVLNRYGGALKAEHGTGRAVAPYVEAEWGREAWEIMRDLKQLLDPQGILNPDVIITQDPNTHLRHLKIMPVVETEVDKCVECGFCERRCPSRDYTLTPRQRIGIRRALRRLEKNGQKADYQDILKDFQHAGMDTCAVDGMCATDCPVDINTGELIKRLRRENHSERANRLALFAARNFAFWEKITVLLLRTGHIINRVFGQNAMQRLTQSFRKINSGFPLWGNMPQVPRAGDWNPIPDMPGTEKVVYFPSCISRAMGDDIALIFKKICLKSNISPLIPTDIVGSCCGQIFASKGFSPAYTFKANEAIEKAWKWSEGGQWPLVMDLTSCSQYLQNCRPYLDPENQHRFDRLRFLDSIEFIHDLVLPRIQIKQKKSKITFHPVCSVYKMGLMGKIEAIGRACAEEVHIPALAGCCGMAGDRGFYYPELTKAATRMEALEVKQQSFDGYYTSAQTCAMNFSEAVGQNYKSMLHLLDEVA